MAKRRTARRAPAKRKTATRRRTALRATSRPTARRKTTRRRRRTMSANAKGLMANAKVVLIAGAGGAGYSILSKIFLKDKPLPVKIGAGLIGSLFVAMLDKNAGGGFAGAMLYDVVNSSPIGMSSRGVKYVDSAQMNDCGYVDSRTGSPVLQDQAGNLWVDKNGVYDLADNSDSKYMSPYALSDSPYALADMDYDGISMVPNT